MYTHVLLYIHFQIMYSQILHVIIYVYIFTSLITKYNTCIFIQRQLQTEHKQPPPPAPLPVRDHETKQTKKGSGLNQADESKDNFLHIIKLYDMQTCV